ncbi:hypothetical protein T484DRAFT_1842036 [Baffinella frigidus]|nr:hypothetical protein T484DRAFT_1842036 [Cryptophyta sp. CCMP2293]
MKRSSTGGGGDGGKKQKGADFEGDFPRGKPSASDREDMKMKPQHKVVRKSEGESSLFKSEGARENQEAAAAELAKEKKKIRGKNLKATTAKRTARAKSDAKLTRGGEETEDLGDAWSEREMKLPKVVEPLRFKKVNEGMLLLGVNEGMLLLGVVKEVREAVNEGMLLLGVVKEVREAEALISLPNNLSGWVEVDQEVREAEALISLPHNLSGWVEVDQALISLPNNLSGWIEVDQVSDELENLIEESLEDEDAEPPALSDFLWVGLSVRCMVLSTAIVSGKGKQASSHHKHINVSVKPSLVNRGLSIGSVHVGMKLYGAVSAIEEHGYAVSLGNRELNAFLPFDEVLYTDMSLHTGMMTLTAGDRNGKLKVGQLVEGRVTKLQKGTHLLPLSQ